MVEGTDALSVQGGTHSSMDAMRAADTNPHEYLAAEKVSLTPLELINVGPGLSNRRADLTSPEDAAELTIYVPKSKTPAPDDRILVSSIPELFDRERIEIASNAQRWKSKNLVVWLNRTRRSTKVGNPVNLHQIGQRAPGSVEKTAATGPGMPCVMAALRFHDRLTHTFSGVVAMHYLRHRRTGVT